MVLIIAPPRLFECIEGFDFVMHYIITVHHMVMKNLLLTVVVTLSVL